MSSGIFLQLTSFDRFGIDLIDTEFVPWVPLLQKHIVHYILFVQVLLTGNNICV